MKLLCVLAFVAFAAADVSHLFRGNNPRNRVNDIRRPVQSLIATEPEYQRPYGTDALTYYGGSQILRSESHINDDGSYHYAYETDNGINAQEQGQQRSVEGGTIAQGSYQYVSPEGVPVAVQYVADENGFQPQSDVLPVAPPTPDYILRSLQYNAAHPEEERPQITDFNRFRVVN